MIRSRSWSGQVDSASPYDLSYNVPADRTLLVRRFVVAHVSGRTGGQANLNIYLASTEQAVLVSRPIPAGEQTLDVDGWWVVMPGDTLYLAVLGASAVGYTCWHVAGSLLAGAPS